MFKLITLLRRRADLNVADFRAYYEANHRRIGEKYLAGHASHYVRRYIEPLPGAGEPAHDVVMEIWLPDRAAYDRLKARLTETAVAQEIAEDEEKLFDRDATVSFTVHEVASDMS